MATSPSGERAGLRLEQRLERALRRVPPSGNPVLLRADLLHLSANDLSDLWHGHSR